jgi:hypothetical protein
MSALRKVIAKKSASARAKASKPQSQPEPELRDGWPGVVQYALTNWQRTLRACVLSIVAFAMLLLAARLGVRFWP